MRRAVLIPALVILAMPLAGEALGWRFLRAPVESVATRKLEREVSIGEPFRLHLLGGVRLRAGSLRIAPPQDFDLPHFLDAEDISLKLRYGDLWDFRKTGDLRVADLDVARLDARLVRDGEGRGSWEFSPPDPDRKRPPPAVDHLKVRDGFVHFRDPAMPADLKVRFDTREGEADAAPVAHAEVEGELRGHPLRGKVVADGWLPAGGTGDTARPVSLKGSLDYAGIKAGFEGGVTDLFGKRRIKGEARVEGASLGLVGRLIDKPLPTTSPFSLQGRLDNEGDVWRVDVDRATIGSSRLAGALVLDPSGEVTRLDGKLGGELLALADLGPAFGTRSDEGKPAPKRPGKVIPDRPLDLPSLKKMDARIRIDLAKVDLGKAFAVPISPFKAELNLNGGEMGLAQIDARTARGRLSGTLTVDAREKTPAWRSDLAWQGIRLEDWIRTDRGKSPSGRKGRSGKGNEPPYFTGTLSGRAKLTGTGDSTAKLLASLNGEALLSVRDGSLSHLVIEVLGLDVAQSLGVVLKGDESLPVQCAVMDLQAKNGRVSPRVGMIDTPVTLIVADGSVNLADERLDLRLAAKPKNFSPFTARSPIRVQGTFAAPDAGPEPGPIAARVLGGLALGLINPLAAILPFIDPGDDPGSPCSKSLARLREAQDQATGERGFRR